MKRVFVALALLAASLPASPTTTAFAQSARALEHRAEVSGPVSFGSTPGALRDMVQTKALPAKPRGGRDFKPGSPVPVSNTNPTVVDPLAAKGVGASSATVLPKGSTEGTPIDPNYRVAPPDTTGDIGKTHYVQWVNLRYSMYKVTRSTDPAVGMTFERVLGPLNGNLLWQGFGGACEAYNDGDPLVQYDQFADRWVLTQFAVSAQPYTQCVAVSKTGDPTGEYHLYAYSYGRDFNDYPKMGVWHDGYYITYNMFRSGRSFVGNRVCAFERDRMLQGLSARQICAQTSNSYHSLVPADIEGPTQPEAGTPNVLLSIGSSALYYWKFAVNWSAGTGTLTGPSAISGVSFSRACGGGECIPQPGTSNQLDSLADRLMYRLGYRRFLNSDGSTKHESLVINHSVATNSVSGIRWYELRNAAGKNVGSATPVVNQQGTYAPSADFRWMGSAAMDKTGGIAIGYNISNGSTIKPSIRYAFRGPADAAGTLSAEQAILAGTGSQQPSLSRWGDYSTISVDPVDDCTMVFTTEYLPANGEFNWSTYIYSFKLSTCQ